MSVVVITPPANLAVSLDEAKAHLRVDYAEDDDSIALMVAAAIAAIDGPAGWLGRCLVNQMLELRVDGFCADFHQHHHGRHEIQLPCPPVTAVASIKYDDTTGAEQIADPAIYRVIGAPERPCVAVNYGLSWPSARAQREAVRIRYVAGYGPDGSSVPAAIRAAILLTVGHLFENRQSVVVDASRVQAIELPQGVAALLGPYRVLS